MIRALIFDFDGLMCDTESTARRSWEEFYRAHGFELPLDLWETCIGTWESPFDPVRDLATRRARPLTADEIVAREARETELASSLPLLPGVTAHLDAAARSGLPLGVASSSSREWVAGHLERLGVIGRFAVLSTRDDVRHTKPDPGVYLTAVAALGVPADEVMAYEDSTNGLLAAKAAGVRCVVVPGPMTRGGDFSLADVVLSSLDDVEPESLWSYVDAGYRRR